MFSKTISRALVFASIVLGVGCSNQPANIVLAPTATAAENISIILSIYCKDISSGLVSHDSLYSLPMKNLMKERRDFYKEFFSNAFHSDLVSISSSYDIRTIVKDNDLNNAYMVKAAELIHFKLLYRLDPGGYPLINAARWALTQTDNSNVQKLLQERIEVYQDSLLVESTAGYGVDFVVEHNLVVEHKNNIYQILEDSYTDANPQDNPKGTDVITWTNGTFSRTQPEYADFTEYKIYHTSIEELGNSFISDWSK